MNNRIINQKIKNKRKVIRKAMMKIINLMINYRTCKNSRKELEIISEFK